MNRDNKMLSATLVRLLAVALCFDWTQCDVLVITADNQLSEVCVNDASIALGPYASKIRRLDRMSLPAGWNDDGNGCIAVKAYNNRRVTPEGGILACVDSGQFIGLVWQCVDPSQLASQSCCSSCADPAWDDPSSGDLYTSKGAQLGKKRVMKSLPAQCRVPGSTTRWIWANDYKQTYVCCRAKPCASGCLRCERTGPGQCDSERCILGFTGLRWPSPVCISKCCVDVRTSGISGDFPSFTLYNNATGAVYNKTATADQAAMWIDITTCTPGDYYETSDPAGTTWVINMWANDLTLTGYVVVDLASGGMLDWMGVQQLDGTGMFVNIGQLYRRGISFASFCIAGYPRDMNSQVVTVNNYVIQTDPPIAEPDVTTAPVTLP